MGGQVRWKNRNKFWTLDVGDLNALNGVGTSKGENPVEVVFVTYLIPYCLS